MNEFSELQEKTGTSNKGIARLLGVKVYSISNWKQGVCSPPDLVIKKMRVYAKSAKNIFKKES